MLIFQIVMYVMIALFTLATIGEENMKHKPIYASVLCASIIGLAISYLFT